MPFNTNDEVDFVDADGKEVRGKIIGATGEHSFFVQPIVGGVPVPVRKTLLLRQ